MRIFQFTALAAALVVPTGYGAPVSFSAMGTFDNGAVLSGTVTIDTSSGAALSGDLAVSGIVAHYTMFMGQFAFGTPPPFVTALRFDNGQATNGTLDLLFEPVSLVGYGGGHLCGLSPINCPDPANFAWVTQYGTLNVSSTANLQGGVLTPTVPEPASVMLVSAALLALGWRRCLWQARTPCRADQGKPFMDQLANKTAYGSAEWRRQRSGARMGMAGLGLLSLAFPLWKARDFFPTLATKRVIAIARVSTLHEGTDLQLQRAFTEAKSSFPTEATLEPDRNRALHGRLTYSVSVTADTAARARAELATFTDVLRAAFPAAENNLVVTPGNSTVPAANELSRRISFGTRAAVIFTMLAGQLLIVTGAQREGMRGAGLLVAVAMPVIMLIETLFFPDDSDDVLANFLSNGEWKFALLLLALTPLSVILSLCLMRRSRPAAGRHRRA